MSAVPAARRLFAARFYPAVTVSVMGSLSAFGVISLWVAPPPEPWQWVVLWELVVGIGFASTGCAVTAVDRGSLPGLLFLLAAALLLISPLARAVNRPTLADALAVAAAAVVIPLGLLRIVPRGPAARALRGLESLITVAGVGCVLATVVQQLAASVIAATVVALALFCAGWLQFEVTSGDDRRRLLWVVLGVCCSVPTGALFLIAANELPVGALTITLIVALLSLVLPLTVAVALLAPASVDVRSVIRQVVVIAVMVTLVVAVYSGVDAVAHLLTARPPAAVGVRGLTVVVIAAGFHPVMVRVRAIMDELLFGGSADPVNTLARLGTQLTAGTAPREWLDTLRAALAVPGVVLRQEDEVLAESGSLDGARTAVTPLRTGGEHVGDLVVALPAEHLRLTPATQAVLGLVAVPLAQALHAARLSEQLKASRGRVVTALEDERRRMRRDLHDGLGPTLTGVAYSADAAVNLVHTDPDQAVHVLRELRADTGEAIAEVRRIVYGLRPRALDELGLVGAVRQRVSHLRAADGRPMTVDVVAPAELQALPAAVEVAAYRVAVEAVTNVARHAEVSTASVEFSVRAGTILRVVVADQGRPSDPWRAGVGLTSMRERVEQIGGALTVESGPSGATITADLPLSLPPAD